MNEDPAPPKSRFKWDTRALVAAICVALGSFCGLGLFTFSYGEGASYLRNDPASCANCHSRIDALGFGLENYDPLGRWRDAYRDGTPIDASGELRGGAKIDGVDGLHKYLDANQSKFRETLANRLLAYALGRSELVGDLPLLGRMRKHLDAGGGMAGLVEQIVTSRQFRYHGGDTTWTKIPEDPGD